MTDPLVRSWAFNWAAEGRSPRTMALMQPFVTRFSESIGGSLMTATRPDCERFISDQTSRFMSNHAWRSLRSFYKFVSEDMDAPNPMAKVKAPKVPINEAVRVATEEDVLKMLRACSPWTTMTKARDAAMISLLWATGLRRTELANLRVSDLDLDSMTLVVRESKNGRSRRVPFDARACGHLLRYLARRENRPAVQRHPDVLWLGKNGPLGSDGIRQAIERLRTRAGVEISAHAMRRGLAARALKAGVSQSSLMAICGWTNATMPNRYVRSVAAEVAEAEYRRVLG